MDGGGPPPDGDAAASGTGDAASDSGVGEASGCASGNVICDGQCASTDADPNNCGKCSNVCASGATCVSGVCVCASESVTCGGVCADTDNNLSHCGQCDNSCAYGSACIGGLCKCEGLICGAICKHTLVDPNNCGSCGKTCAPHLGCTGGKCACPPGGSDCGAYCALSGSVCATTSQISLGAKHSCARLGDGQALCAGFNHQGQLGDGSILNTKEYPGFVSGLASVAQVALGAAHSCARNFDGSVACWGAGNGQLGNGTLGDKVYATPVLGIAGTVELTAGGSHTCARHGDGSVQCWGRNGVGQLGDGTKLDRLVPTPVPGLAAVLQVAAGGSHTCARMKDKTVRCWGNNSSGQLGNGGTGDQASPLPVPELVGVAELALGASSTCARMIDGTVQCWGANFSGQLGDGTKSVFGRPSPAPVFGLTGVVQLAIGSAHACARLSDGSARCWGNNFAGQIGDGTQSNLRLSPVTVSALPAITDIAAGGTQTCARRGNGDVYCWGSNNDGQLGVGMPTGELLLPTLALW